MKKRIFNFTYRSVFLLYLSFPNPELTCFSLQGEELPPFGPDSDFPVLGSNLSHPVISESGLLPFVSFPSPSRAERQLF